MLSFSIEEFLSCISESAADVAVLIRNCVKTFLSNALSMFFSKGTPWSKECA